MDGCQNYGAPLDPLNTRCSIILRTRKRGTIILTTTHILLIRISSKPQTPLKGALKPVLKDPAICSNSHLVRIRINSKPALYQPLRPFKGALNPLDKGTPTYGRSRGTIPGMLLNEGLLKALGRDCSAKAKAPTRNRTLRCQDIPSR